MVLRSIYKCTCERACVEAYWCLSGAYNLLAVFWRSFIQDGTMPLRLFLFILLCIIFSNQIISCCYFSFFFTEFENHFSCLQFLQIFHASPALRNMSTQIMIFIKVPAHGLEIEKNLNFKTSLENTLEKHISLHSIVN